MHHPHFVLAGHLNHLLEERQLDALGGGIAGEVEHQHLGLGPGIADSLLQLLEEVDARNHRHVADVGAGDHEAVGMHGIGRIRHQHRVARSDGGEREMHQPFLGTDGDDGLGFLIELDAVALPVPAADRPPQPRDAARDGITVRAFALHHFDQLVDDVLRRGLIGIAHAEVDDVLAPGSRLGFQLVDDVEDIRRQALDSRKIVFHPEAFRKR